MIFKIIDKSGQSLRYPSIKNGKNNFPEIVRFEILRDSVDEMYSLLDGCTMRFDAILEFIAKSRTNY